MKVKIKAAELKEKLVGLLRLGNSVFPSKLSYAIAYNTEKLEAEYNRLEKERVKICERYAEKDENGKAVTVKFKEDGTEKEKYKFATKEDEMACDEEYKELLETEIEFENIRTVKWNEVEKCDKNERYSIPTIKDIRAISFMMEE